MPNSANSIIPIGDLFDPKPSRSNEALWVCKSFGPRMLALLLNRTFHFDSRCFRAEPQPDGSWCIVCTGVINNNCALKASLEGTAICISPGLVSSTDADPDYDGVPTINGVPITNQPPPKLATNGQGGTVYLCFEVHGDGQVFASEFIFVEDGADAPEGQCEVQPEQGDPGSDGVHYLAWQTILDQGGALSVPDGACGNAQIRKCGVCSYVVLPLPGGFAP